MSDTFKELVTLEMLEKLKEGGFEHLVDAFLLNEKKVYTKKGRLNKSGACRVLGCKPKDLDEAMRRCKEILSSDEDEEEQD
jgi:hypothetical protein